MSCCTFFFQIYTVISIDAGNSFHKAVTPEGATESELENSTGKTKQT